jgi:predicted nucleotidyltransferase
MDMRDEWIAALRAWAAKNDCVRELWLFGSRAKGTSEPESDIDIALALMPPDGKTNWHSRPTRNRLMIGRPNWAWR